MSEVLELINLKKYYGNDKSAITKALDGISFKINKGEFVSIRGKSGSGKTTLLNIISTIDKPTSGIVKINDEDVTELKSTETAIFRRNHLGFIFQDFKLIDNLTVEENIALALVIKKHPHNEIEKEICEIADILEIKENLKKYPFQLSGGQKQRVAVARAIVTKPSLVLADEPTGALDSENSILLMELLKKLNIASKTTILLVTHDSFCAKYASSSLQIKDGKLI